MAKNAPLKHNMSLSPLFLLKRHGLEYETKGGLDCSRE